RKAPAKLTWLPADCPDASIAPLSGCTAELGREAVLDGRGPATPALVFALAHAFNSRAVIVYLKLSGSRLSRRSLPFSPCGYMRKPIDGPLEPGSLTSAASL